MSTYQSTAETAALLEDELERLGVEAEVDGDEEEGEVRLDITAPCSVTIVVDADEAPERLEALEQLDDDEDIDAVLGALAGVEEEEDIAA